MQNLAVPTSALAHDLLAEQRAHPSRSKQVTEDRKHNVPFRQIVKIRVALFQTFGWRAGSGWVVVQADTYKLTSCFLSR